MNRWEDKTSFFDEDTRYYKDTYLEKCNVYDEIECNIYSTEDRGYEIYVSYGIMHGIIYHDGNGLEEKVEEIMKLLADDYDKNGEPSDDFINNFVEKYELQLPMDIFFDTTSLFGF